MRQGGVTTKPKGVTTWQGRGTTRPRGVTTRPWRGGANTRPKGVTMRQGGVRTWQEGAVDETCRCDVTARQVTWRSYTEWQRDPQRDVYIPGSVKAWPERRDEAERRWSGVGRETRRDVTWPACMTKETVWRSWKAMKPRGPWDEAWRNVTSLHGEGDRVTKLEGSRGERRNTPISQQ